LRGGERAAHAVLSAIFSSIKPGTILSFVMPGLDPGIHEAERRKQILRFVLADIHHGLPGQARQ